ESSRRTTASAGPGRLESARDGDSCPSCRHVDSAVRSRGPKSSWARKSFLEIVSLPSWQERQNRIDLPDSVRRRMKPHEWPTGANKEDTGGAVGNSTLTTRIVDLGPMCRILHTHLCVWYSGRRESPRVPNGLCYASAHVQIET